MLEKIKNKRFEYKKALTEAEQQKSRGILGKINWSRCGFYKSNQEMVRAYSEELWENVFASPVMKEKIANRCALAN